METERLAYLYTFRGETIDGKGVLKVGISYDPRKRLRCFRMASIKSTQPPTGTIPRSIRLLYTMPCEISGGVNNSEGALHHKLSCCHAQGEWFWESENAHAILLSSGMKPVPIECPVVSPTLNKAKKFVHISYKGQVRHYLTKIDHLRYGTLFDFC